MLRWRCELSTWISWFHALIILITVVIKFWRFLCIHVYILYLYIQMPTSHKHTDVVRSALHRLWGVVYVYLIVARIRSNCVVSRYNWKRQLEISVVLSVARPLKMLRSRFRSRVSGFRARYLSFLWEDNASLPTSVSEDTRG